MLGPEWGKSLAYGEKTSWKPPRKSSVDFQFTLWPKARKNVCRFGTSVEIERCTSASKGRRGRHLTSGFHLIGKETERGSETTLQPFPTKEPRIPPSLTLHSGVFRIAGRL